MSAVASRKALELCVKWVYSIDSVLKPIEYREGLQSLLHNNGFPSLMDYTLWKRLQYIVRNGNESVHTSKRLDRPNWSLLSPPEWFLFKVDARMLFNGI